MKRITAIILTLLMLALCACSNATPDATNGNGNVGGVTDPVENNTKETEENTSEPEVQESTTQPVTEETAPAFSVDKLSVWGLAEPSFAYEFVGYSEGVSGPDFVGRVYYIASADYKAAQSYIASLADAGWGDTFTDPEEECAFGYTGTMGEYKLLYHWEEDGSIVMSVIDRSVSAVWDDDLNVYVIPEYGEYGSYGEYNIDYLYS